MKKIWLIISIFSLFTLAGCWSTSSVPAQIVATITWTTMVTYTMEEIGTHASNKSCRAVIGTKVYDFTFRVSQYPEWSKKILAICGKNATKTFTKIRRNKVTPKIKLADFYIWDIK